MIYMVPLLLVLLIPIVANMWVKSNYNKYLKVRNAKGLNGSEVARMILEKNGIGNIKVREAKGLLSDNYNPSKGRKTVNLSQAVYNEPSVASIAIAAHECGHALQDRDGYVFMNMRSALVPVVNAVSYLSYICIVVSFFLQAFDLIWVAIISLLCSLVFQLVTLPVEFNASKRALAELNEMGIVDSGEYDGVRSMLKSAAWTYVAAVAATCIQLLRLVLIARNRR